MPTPLPYFSDAGTYPTGSPVYVIYYAAAAFTIYRSFDLPTLNPKNPELQDNLSNVAVTKSNDEHELNNPTGNLDLDLFPDECLAEEDRAGEFMDHYRRIQWREGERELRTNQRPQNDDDARLF